MYLNKMSSVLTNLSVIQKLAKDLVRARQLNYSEECIPYYANEHKFMIEHIDSIRNPSGFMLKSTLIRHRGERDRGQKKQLRHCSSHNELGEMNMNHKWSSRLEALPLVECLPQQYCLFAFDFAGCGKSQGENITYGLRQAEDVSSIIDYLKTNKGIKEFILWGRSMGAVVALLYAIELSESSKESITAQAQLNRIKGLVLDSPFCDFREITKQIGLKKVKIPQFLLDLALTCIENSFKELLKDDKRGDKIYNPFQIKLGEQNIDTKIPTVFLYSLTDQVVPKEHSQKIIKSYRTLFDKIVMETCSHNQSRPKDIMDKVFEALKKYEVKLKNGRMSGGLEVKLQHNLTRNRSLDFSEKGNKASRRGISVQSKQKEKQIIFVESSFTEQPENYRQSNKTILSYSSLKIQPKRQKISLKVSQNPYVIDTSSTADQFRQANNNSPLKIRLSNSFNRFQNKISVSIAKKGQLLKSSVNNFYNTLDYDNSILQKKLLKQKLPLSSEQILSHKNIEHKSNFKYRRNNQLNRKVEYQLNHTRYL